MPESDTQNATENGRPSVSGAFPSVPCALGMAASSAGAGAHGRGLTRAVPTILAALHRALKDAGVRGQQCSPPRSYCLLSNLSEGQETPSVTKSCATSAASTDVEAKLR